MHRLAPCLLVVAALASCVKTGDTKQEKQFNPTSPMTGKPLIRSSNSDFGTAVAPGGTTLPAAGGMTPPQDIMWTDPDNPEAGIPELATLMSATKKGVWDDSMTSVKRRSVREGKPMLIWFTDSLSSPMCKALNQELFTSDEFGSWAADNLIRMRVDSNVDVKDAESIGDGMDREARIKDYNNVLKKRYKVMGYPSLVVVSPNGEVVGNYRGYKRGDATLMWGKLKHAVAVSQESYKGWRGGLEKKGYRDWEGKKDQRIFAKLVSYKQGTLILIEPDGQRSRTKETNLSDVDRAWLAEQKKLRNLQ